MKKFLPGVVAVVMCVAAVRAGEAGVITQWSTIDALLKGDYDGSASLAEVKRHGDFGLGTFNELDGEMLLMDGKVYQIDGSGVVREPGDDVRTPFAAALFFKADIVFDVPSGLTMEQVQARIDAALPSANLFYAVKVTGKFAEVRTRSVPKQAKPYPPLATVTKGQSLFTIKATEGTLAGLKCPGFVKSLNVPGYHFHYLAADRSGGGHVLGLVTGEGVRASVSVAREFAVKLPASASFEALDLSGDRSKELHAVESERK